MRVSIVIPLYNSPIIDKLIQAILDQDFPDPYEIIVVGLDKAGLVPKQPTVKHLAKETPLSTSQATNRGIREANGEMILFTDHDCIPQTGWINNMVRELEKADVVVGGVAFPKANYWNLGDNVAIFYQQHCDNPARDVTGGIFGTLNLGVRRSVFEKIGLLDESLQPSISQDTDWFYRYRQTGALTRFCPDAVVSHHHNRNSFLSIIRHGLFYGIGKAWMIHKYPHDTHLARGTDKAIFWTPFQAAKHVLKLALKHPVVKKHLHVLPVMWLFYTSWHVGVRRQFKSNRPYPPSNIPSLK